MRDQYVVAVGVACIDEYYSAPSWMTEGDKMIIQPMPPSVGGMVANAACALAGYGLKTYLSDTMNNGAAAQMILSDLRACGVDLSMISFDESLPDAKCIIILTPNERSVFVVDSQKPQNNSYAAHLHMYENASYVYSTVRDFSRFFDALAFANHLKDKGVQLVFDVESTEMDAEGIALLEKADILFFNEFGFALYGMSGPLERLFDAGVRIVCVTRGKNGCWIRTRDEAFDVPAVDTTVLDTTGAGDAFNAAFLRCVMEEKTLMYAAKFASAAAGLAVAQYGSKNKPHPVSVVEAMMQKNFGVSEA